MSCPSVSSQRQQKIPLLTDYTPRKLVPSLIHTANPLNKFTEASLSFGCSQEKLDVQAHCTAPGVAQQACSMARASIASGQSMAREQAPVVSQVLSQQPNQGAHLHYGSPLITAPSFIPIASQISAAASRAHMAQPGESLSAPIYWPPAPLVTSSLMVSPSMYSSMQLPSTSLGTMQQAALLRSSSRSAAGTLSSEPLACRAADNLANFLLPSLYSHLLNQGYPISLAHQQHAQHILQRQRADCHQSTSPRELQLERQPQHQQQRQRQQALHGVFTTS